MEKVNVQPLDKDFANLPPQHSITFGTPSYVRLSGVKIHEVMFRILDVHFNQINLDKDSKTSIKLHFKRKSINKENTTNDI